MTLTHSDPKLGRAILNTLVYADVFDYPLTLAEIHRYLPGMSASLAAVSNLAASQSFLKPVGGYYTLPGREALVSTRARRQKEADRLWPAARFYGRWLAGLPFVRMVAVTGSLAVNNTEPRADIDYLIVTRPGRLWLCRLLTLGVVRLAGLRGVSLCPNFLLTQNALDTPQHSLYAAHEFAQMVPLAGFEVYRRMWALNPWVQEFLPNAGPLLLPAEEASTAKPVSWLRSLLEWLLLSPLGARLERWEMDRKIRKLSRENLGNPEAVFSADLCKGHSNRHGLRTELLFDERLTHLAVEAVV